jgi:hypothetical protein
MANPWLNIPLADYEGHMGSAQVQQLDALSELFAEALERCRPASIAVLGIAGGNGLDRVDSGITKRIVGIDITRCIWRKSSDGMWASLRWSSIVWT